MGLTGPTWRGEGLHGWGRLLQRFHPAHRVRQRDPQPLGQSRQGASRAITEGAQGGLQGRQQDVNPLIGFGSGPCRTGVPGRLGDGRS